MFGVIFEKTYCGYYETFRSDCIRIWFNTFFEENLIKAKIIMPEKGSIMFLSFDDKETELRILFEYGE